MIRVFLVDDQTLVRQGIRSLLALADGIEVVAEAADGRQAIHDGPYAETKELLGGFYVIDVPSLDDAIGWAKQIPLSAHGAIEVRPVLGMPD